MPSKLAECISRKDIFPGIRLLKFQYIYHCDESVDEPLDIIIKDNDLLLECTIERSKDIQKDIIMWNSIRIKAPKKNVINGRYEIEGIDNNMIAHGSFHFKSVPAEKKLKSIYCDRNSYISIRLIIYHKDENLHPLPEAYNQYFNNKSLSDVTFFVQDEEFPAHKLVLSVKSDVFTKMFETDMLEKINDKVEINDIEPKVFKLLLKFMYCGKIDDSDTNDTEDLIKLIIAADRYAVHKLISFCSFHISQQLCINNVIDILIIADQLKIDSLKEECIYLIINEKDKVSETEAYKDMIKSGRADLISELFLYDPVTSN